jgi:hypothetical protein
MGGLILGGRGVRFADMSCSVDTDVSYKTFGLKALSDESNLNGGRVVLSSESGIEQLAQGPNLSSNHDVYLAKYIARGAK